ncbi:MAG: OsmC family protein [Saprospiraceae bacterium]
MATKIKIKNIPTGYQSIISNGKHSILGDEPISAKGTDLGLSPPELVLAGIAMCKVATVRNVARRKGWDVKDVDAELKQVVKRNKDGSFTTSVETLLHIEGDLTEEQRAVLSKESDNCYVTRLIKGEWDLAASTPLEEEVTTA